VRHWVFCLEGPSEKALLQGLLPKLIAPDIQVVYLVFEGKQDLEKRLLRRLRGWQLPDTQFVVLRDKDAGDCKAIKQHLVSIVHQAGRATETLVRIACHEIESWYLGDLKAVEQGLGVTGLARQQNKRQYRNPDDRVVKPAKELVDLTKGKYQKLAGSREIGSYLDLDNNQSKRFQVFVSGLRKLVGTDKISPKNVKQ
jgi:hypothetical protein